MTDKTRAVILRATDYSETSLILNLYTRDFGLIRAIAKGAKRPGGRLFGSLDLFSHSEIVLYLKKTGLHILSEADLLDAFPGLGDSKAAYTRAHYIAELLLGMTAEGDPAPPVYALAVSTFEALARGEPPENLLLKFQGELLFHTGHHPRTGECLSCHGALPARGQVHFLPADGGALCGRCASSAPPGGLDVKTGTLALLAKFADPRNKELVRAKIPGPTLREMSSVFQAAFEAVMERELRTVRFIAD